MKYLLFLLLVTSAFAQSEGKRLVKLTGEIPAGCIDLGNGYYDCEERAVLPPEATPLATGATRYNDLANADKLKVFRAVVHRMKDGTSLRAKLATLLGITIPPKVRLKDLNLTDAQKDAIRAKLTAFLLAQTTDKLTVTIGDAQTGDIIEDTMQPHIWLGEASP